MSYQETSRAALDSRDRGSDRSRVYRDIVACGGYGMTCDELELTLGLLHQNASARVRELKQVDLIRDSGKRRKTRTGRAAIVWVAA